MGSNVLVDETMSFSMFSRAASRAVTRCAPTLGSRNNAARSFAAHAEEGSPPGYLFSRKNGVKKGMGDSIWRAVSRRHGDADDRPLLQGEWIGRCRELGKGRVGGKEEAAGSVIGGWVGMGDGDE